MPGAEEGEARAADPLPFARAGMPMTKCLRGHTLTAEKIYSARR